MGKGCEPLQIKNVSNFFSFHYHANNYRDKYLRGEGDSNSRGRKTNGLAIHRRAGLGHPRKNLPQSEIKHSDKKVVSCQNKY